MSTSGKKEIERMMRVIYYLGFDTSELQRYVEEMGNCEGISMERTKVELKKKGFVK